MDYLVLYRPGNGTIWILKHDDSYFIPVYRQGEPAMALALVALISAVPATLHSRLTTEAPDDKTISYFTGQAPAFLRL